MVRLHPRSSVGLLVTGALILEHGLAGSCVAAGQGTNASPSAGLVNDWLRGKSASAEAWDLGAEFRGRYESKVNAGLNPNADFIEALDNSNDYFEFRTKVHLGWSPAPWITGFVEGRDARSEGDSRLVVPEDSFDLFQAYVQLGDGSHFPLSLKAGRQEMQYGDDRYVGSGDWSNLGRSFDAVKARFEHEQFWVDAFTGRQVLPRNDHIDESNDYDLFSGLYGSTRALVPWQQTDLYFLARNVEPGSPTAISSTIGGPGPRDIYTVGTRWKSAPSALGNWDYTFEAAGQFGSINQGGARLEHRGFAVNVTGGYTLKETFGKPRFNIGYDYGSGDSNPNDSVDDTFELLFGTNHKFYGLMDILGLRNMHIPRAGASIKPATSLQCSVEWLGFWMVEAADFLYPESGPGRNQNGYGRNPAFNSYVGNEIDLLLRWQPVSWGQVQGGYGHFFAGDYIRQSVAAGGYSTEDADWFYVQATLEF